MTLTYRFHRVDGILDGLDDLGAVSASLVGDVGEVVHDVNVDSTDDLLS